MSLLCQDWTPDPLFIFPRSGKRNLRFQLCWLNDFKWLVYSPSQDGAFCLYCKLFAPVAGIGPGHQPRGALVLTKFSKWSTAKEDFKCHESRDYHKSCVAFGCNLKNVASKTHESIDMQLDKQKKAEISENRHRLIPIIETVMLCGKQNWALRGTNDCGRLNLQEAPVHNDGGFRSLLRFRANGGDTCLTDHLQNSASNASYLSPMIQNEIIFACNDLILSKLVRKVNDAKCFSVLADETADVSGIEQFSLCVRYLDGDVGKIREDFLQFVPVYDVTGQGLAKVITESLSSFGIDLRYLRGQGYDGAAAMSGRFNGVQALIRESHPLATYVHCSAHSLNLAVSDACNMPDVRNCMGVLGTVHNFLNTPKRLIVLQQSVEKLMPCSEITRLKSLCPTRWIERHDSVLVFLDLLHPVIESLEIISEWSDRDSSAGATQLLLSIKQPDFLVTLHVVAKVFSYNLPLCRQLQTCNIDLAKAMELAKCVTDVIKQMRENASVEFTAIFSVVTKLCADLEVDLVKPRITKRQTKRCNVQAESAEDYFRIAIFVPFLDSFLVQLHDRLLAHSDLLSGFMCLLPQRSKRPGELSTISHRPEAKELAEFCSLVDCYAVDLSCSKQAAIGELELWYRMIQALDQPPKTALDAYLLCDGNILPSIKHLLRILATLPVTTCTSERSFSTLRRIKTYLRNTIGNNRLNGLALMNIHREFTLCPNEILDELAKKPRRLPFALK